MERKIDLVYLWFDPNDKNWQEQKLYWQRQSGIEPEFNNNIRWIDNDELRYALRSADKFAPWINHIYIVTGFGHVPDWLDTNNEKITIVPHEQIMPRDAIPTFNSNSIESCVVNIPGLSEYFLMACDDMFFGRPVSPDYFFNKKGKLMIWYINNRFFSGKYGLEIERVGLWQKHHIFLFKLINDVFEKKLHKYMPSHNIEPYRKSIILATQNHPMIKDFIDKTIRNKFRKPTDIPRWIYTLHGMLRGECKMQRVHAPKSRRHFIYNTWYGISNTFKLSPQYHDSIDKLHKKLPVLFCINKADNDDFKKIFPNKSRYEK